MGTETSTGTRPRSWLLVATGVVGLVAALLVLVVRYYEIRAARLAAERAQVEAERIRVGDRPSSTPEPPRLDVPKAEAARPGTEPPPPPKPRTTVRDLGAFANTKAGKTYSVDLPEDFGRVEVCFYQGGPSRLTLNAAWKGHLRVNGNDVVRFKNPVGKSNDLFLFHDYVGGTDYTEVNDYRPQADPRFIDVTRFVRRGVNQVFYYHEQHPDLPMGVVLRITEK